jgi:hypothetical protein
MQLQIHFVGIRRTGLLIPASPRFPERVVPFPAALRTWPVPGGEGHGLIEEEKLGITVRRHDYPVTASEFQNARDPAPALVGADYFPAGVVQRAATVAHHRAASCGPNEVTAGIDAVLEGHEAIMPYAMMLNFLS